MFKKALAVTAAMMMAVAPVAAQANTRAMSASIALDAAPMPLANGTQDDDDDDGLLIILALLLIAGGLAFAVAGDTQEGNDASPGTGG